MSETAQVEIIRIGETLILGVQTGHNPHVWLDRANGGLVQVRPAEIHGVIEALCTGAGILAEGEAARVEALTAAGRMGRQVVEARRARRKRMGADND